MLTKFIQKQTKTIITNNEVFASQYSSRKTGSTDGVSIFRKLMLKQSGFTATHRFVDVQEAVIFQETFSPERGIKLLN